MASNSTEITSIIAKLEALYPKAFSTDPSRVRPLAIGVKKALRQELHLEAPNGLRDALRSYAGSPDYLKATIEGAARVDLEGRPLGTVTAQQAAYARQRLADMAARQAAGEISETPQPRRAPARVGTTQARMMVHSSAGVMPQRPTDAKPSAAQGQRLGLADLKRAAAARRRASGSA